MGDLGRVLYLSDEEYEWLLKRLEEPPKEMPRLRKLFEEKSVFDDE